MKITAIQFRQWTVSYTPEHGWAVGYTGEFPEERSYTLVDRNELGLALKRNDELKDSLAIAMEALKMYGKATNWKSSQTIGGGVCEEWTVLDEKYWFGSDRAKEALSKIDEILSR